MLRNILDFWREGIAMSMPQKPEISMKQPTTAILTTDLISGCAFRKASRSGTSSSWSGLSRTLGAAVPAAGSASVAGGGIMVILCEASTYTDTPNLSR